MGDSKELVERSNRLGSDPRSTNYAGGNTYAKVSVTDPATGEAAQVMYVKGSGGDLGTLTHAGLAGLYVEKVKALKKVYRGLDHEDEMVALFDYCLFGRGGAAPSIDTAMHGLVDYAHVDHLHPDSIIALATSVDGPALTKECFGEEIAKKFPNAKGCILGGHGLTTWAESSAECEERSKWAIHKAEEFIAKKSKAEPFGKVIKERIALAESARREKASKLAPTLRGIASRDARMVGHFSDAQGVLDFIASDAAPRLAALGTSCPDHFLRTKVSPMFIDLPADASIEETISRANELHEEYRKNYTAYYQRYADKSSPAMRGADPAVILIPGI